MFTAVRPHGEDAPTARRPLAGLTVVVNCRASGVPQGGELDVLVGRLERHADVVAVERTASLDELAAVWRRDDGTRLVVVGGDGSIHAAANLAGPAREIALIPAGRANNIAHSTGIPTDHAAAARLAATGRVRPIDLIEAWTAERRLVVVESVSAGFLAQARARYHGTNSADLVAGARAGAAALAAFHPLCARLSGSGGVEEVALAQIFVANLPLYEFGLHVAPHADPTDGMLDFVGLQAASRRAVLRMVVGLRRGTRLRRRGTVLRRAPRITLTTCGCSPIVADSTDLGPGPVELTALPHALRLVRP